VEQNFLTNSFKCGNQIVTKLIIQKNGFSSLISDLFLDCELFEADPLLREDYEISEEELRNCVKKTLLEIKDRYP